MTDIDPQALALNLPELVYEALRFANFAAGEGLCAPVDQALARDPDLFLSEYTDKSGDDDWDTMPARIRDALAAFLREAVSAHEALAPFAAVAEHDIGESESDTDLFRPMSAKHARAPLLTVGDLRRARTIIAGPPPPARIEDAEEPSHDRR